MAIFCIKIGENEPSTYAKYNQLYKHGDIVEVLLEKQRKDGTILPDNRSPGEKVEKNFLCIDVDLSHLTKEQKHVLIDSLKAEERDENTGEILKRRIHNVDLSTLPLLSIDEKSTIEINAEKKRLKEDFSMKLINIKNGSFQSTSYDNLKPYIYNKMINKNLIDFPLQENPVAASRAYLKTGEVFN